MKYLQLICKQTAVNNHFNYEDFFFQFHNFYVFFQMLCSTEKKKAAEGEFRGKSHTDVVVLNFNSVLCKKFQ